MAQKQFITFYLEKHLFGLDIRLVREINRHLDITTVDRAPAFVRGLINLRGQIVTVLDLRICLGLAQRESTPNSRCIILKPQTELADTDVADETLREELSGELVGLLVDAIGDVVTVESETMEPPPAHAGGVKGKYLEGVIKLEKQLLIALRATEILRV